MSVVSPTRLSIRPLVRHLLVPLGALALLSLLPGDWGVALGQTAPPPPPVEEPVFAIGGIAPTDLARIQQQASIQASAGDISAQRVASALRTLDPNAGDQVGIIPAAPGQAAVGVVSTPPTSPVPATIQVPTTGDAPASVVVQPRRPEQVQLPPPPPGFTPAAALDITVFKEDGGPQVVAEHRRPVTVTIAITQAMIAAAGGDPRRVTMLRVNPGPPVVYERLPCQVDPNALTLTCETSRTTTFVIAIQPPEFVARPVAADDARFFPQTQFRIEDDAFYDYFQRRGGVDTFGYPVSRAFILDGFKVQIFQRHVMQQTPDGSVRLLNLLDPEVLPLTAATGSQFPSIDEGLKAETPRMDDPAKGAEIVAFLRAEIPDEWEGLPVNFFQTFMASATCAQLFPQGDCREDLLPGFALEIWGAPTSRPMRDPTNPNFVYQRFQRGIMHFDQTTGTTRPILLADYLKSVITGKNLPPDVAQQARESRFFQVYHVLGPRGLVDPRRLIGSDLKNAFEPETPRAVIS